MLAAEENHEDDGDDDHAHNTMMITMQWRLALPPAQLADAELAIIFCNFPLRLVAQSFLEFMKILRNLCKGGVGRDAVWT